MRALRRFALLGLTLALALVGMSLAWNRHTVMSEEEARARHLQEGRERSPAAVELLGMLPPVLRESSGIAVSRAYEGVLWSHNDAGGLPRLFAISPAGDLLGTFLVEGSVARDWEDVSLGPCPPGLGRPGPSCIYVADTGDNERQRASYAVLVVPEPDPRGVDPSDTVFVDAWRVEVTYPDGAHDVEALVVTPEGDLILLTKGRNGRIQVFGVLADAVARGVRDGIGVMAEERRALAIRPQGVVGRMVTGASISPSGARLVVRTYTELYFYRRGPGGSLEPDGDPCFLGQLEPQGEAVDFLDEETVIVASETSWGRQGTIHRIRCR